MLEPASVTTIDLLYAAGFQVAAVLASVCLVALLVARAFRRTSR